VFDRKRLAVLAGLEEWHFWSVGRRTLVTRLLQQAIRPGDGRLVDIGCGTGSIARHLARGGYRVVGIDPLAGEADPSTCRDLAIVRGSALDLPVSSGACAAVLLLDVLEHIDDERALREAHRALRPGGVALISVPALPWLWSQRDDQAGHLRRYTRRTLFPLLARTGFAVDDWTAYECLLLPLVAVSRLRPWRRRSGLAYEDRPGQAVNRLLGWINSAELAIGRVTRWPIGSTLVVRCRRRSTG
jgi:SAM-dependent methyltransferase